MEHLIRLFFKNFLDYKLIKIVHGHINETFQLILKTSEGEENWILQAVNTNVFKNLDILTNNSKVIAEHLVQMGYPKGILFPISAVDERIIVPFEGKYWRVYPFIEDSRNIQKASSPDEVYFASLAIGELYGYIQNISIGSIKNPIPRFHDYKGRMDSFNTALNSGFIGKYQEAENEIRYLIQNSQIVEKVIGYQQKFTLVQQVIHGDPKLGNILFDKSGPTIKAIIDWDTFMVGTPWIDFGDMVRSYTSSGDENEDHVYFNKLYFNALKEGLLESNFLEFKNNHKNLWKEFAKCVIYIQAIRFLTDFIIGNKYYKIDFESHNLFRAKNQISLLKDFIKQEKDI